MIQSPDLSHLATAIGDERMIARAEAAHTSPRATRSDDRPTGCDVGDYLAIHGVIRRATRALRLATAPGRVVDARTAEALRTYWTGYAMDLHGHHTVEDTIFFPALAERDPSVSAELVRSDGDHAELDELISMGHAAFGAIEAGDDLASAHDLMVRLERLMTEHLDFEDADFLPRFARLFDQSEYDAMHQRAVKSSTSLKHLAFVVPFIATWIAPDAWRSLWSTAPLPLRVVYRLTKRRHARLVRTAFGPVLAEALA